MIIKENSSVRRATQANSARLKCFDLESIFRRLGENDHVGGSFGAELNPLDLRKTMFLPQMTVNFHSERPAVFVAEPFADGRNVHAAFDARGGEKVPEVVVSESVKTKFLARCGETLFCALYFHDETARPWFCFSLKSG